MILSIFEKLEDHAAERFRRFCTNISLVLFRYRPAEKIARQIGEGATRSQQRFSTRCLAAQEVWGILTEVVDAGDLDRGASKGAARLAALQDR
jgi:hypothetical protein